MSKEYLCQWHIERISAGGICVRHRTATYNTRKRRPLNLACAASMPDGCILAMSKEHIVTGGIRRPLASIGLVWPALHVMASTGWPVRPDQVPFVFLLAGNGRPMMPMVPVVLAVFSAWLAWLEPMA